MAYYWNVMALSVGVVFCFMLGRTLFEGAEPAPARVSPPASRALHADAGHPRK
ncbi:hypothetical protein [Corallococcus llansteffanensis]|uniref:hypothetical protein n=1 Tax=Corallococcus llansteffanensis TaxID=2316731 RepID=UPI0013157375|nr:hypothetical protein [Corallococcus llansteffanensis]